MQNKKPTLEQLGLDLCKVSKIQLAFSLLLPFALCLAYFFSALHQHWIAAMLCTVGLSFVTYGSVSHDLVHNSYQLSPRVNKIFLSAMELISLRSGSVYRIVHINHHQYYPDLRNDPEGQAASYGLMKTFVEGMIFQFKLGAWAYKRASDEEKKWILAEWIAIAVYLIVSCIFLKAHPSLAAYALLMYAGSWAIPFITSYSVHQPHEIDELKQTKLFRGYFYRIISLEHLYHLEHHLYPKVPHQKWPELAKRLDPFFESQNLITRSKS